MLRSHGFRTARTWTRNPNFLHGMWSKKRWATETEVNAAMATLPRIAARITRLGNWRKAGLDKGLQAALDNHPARWTVPEGPGKPTGRVYVPVRNLPMAHAWLAIVRGLTALLARIEMTVRGWQLRRASNDRRNAHGDTTVQPRPILGGHARHPGSVEPRRAGLEIARLLSSIGPAPLR